MLIVLYKSINIVVAKLQRGNVLGKLAEACYDRLHIPVGILMPLKC